VTDAIEIRQVRELPPEERRRLWGWSDDIFGTRNLNLTYRAPDPETVRFILCVGSHGPVSHAAVLKHHARVNGRSALIGGLGGVLTIPEFQRRGHAALLVRHATTFLRHEWKVDFGLLFCIARMVPYYERLGWRKVTCEVLIDQPSGKVPCPFHVMAFSFTAKFDTIAEIDLGSASW
jgi:GNAT superfamily N-acetyltransferase